MPSKMSMNFKFLILVLIILRLLMMLNREVIFSNNTINMKNVSNNFKYQDKSIHDSESYNYQLIKNKSIIFIYSQNENDILTNDLKCMLYSMRIELKIGIDYVNTKKISIIIFKNYNDYLIVFDTKFQNYLLYNKIGVIVFNGVDKGENIKIDECKLNDKNFDFMINFLHLTKFTTQSIIVEKQVKHNKIFEKLFYNEKNFQSKSLLKCSINEGYVEDLIFINEINNIKHVFVSLISLDDVWLSKLLLIDSFRYLSNNELETGLNRYIQIDIDDIFMVNKMIPEDVHEMIRFQNEFTNRYFIHNNYKFKFTIGYSAFYFDDRRTYLYKNNGSYEAEVKAKKLSIGK
jgi:hypothetical protein